MLRIIVAIVFCCLQKPTKFTVKNNNECMYLADSIRFEPETETPLIFPNKKTTFSIIFAPKSACVRTTLEYFTIFSIDKTEEIGDDEFDYNAVLQISDDKIIQTVCVQGSCNGNGF